MAKKEVKCNFDVVFAQIDSANELKAIAQSIVNQVNEAYLKRFKALQGKAASEVEVSVSTQKEAAEEPKKKPASKKSEASAQKEEVKAKGTGKEEVSQISITDTAAIKKLGLTFEKYNSKCWVVRGDTRPLKDALMGEPFKGIYNSMLKGGGGMVIRNSVAQECAKALGFKVKVN